MQFESELDQVSKPEPEPELDQVSKPEPEPEPEQELDQESKTYQDQVSKLEPDQVFELDQVFEPEQDQVSKTEPDQELDQELDQESKTYQDQVFEPEQVLITNLSQSQSCEKPNLLSFITTVPKSVLIEHWPVYCTLKFLSISKNLNKILNENNVLLPMRIDIHNFDKKLKDMLKKNLITKIKIITDITSYDIARIFFECKNLEELDISGCHIENISNQYILNTTSSLTSINLSNITCNNINEIVYFISLTLSQCQSLNLNKVIISNNNLHDSGASKICNILIKLGINIQVLDLSNNEIGSFGLSALSKILKNSNIRDLNLSGNNLQKGGFSCIFKALSTATKLERLNLSNTKINLNCLLNLVHKKLIFKNLVKLDLSENNICNSGLEIIALFVNKFFIKIKFLNLSNNNTSIKANTKFISKLQNCTNINIIIGN